MIFTLSPYAWRILGKSVECMREQKGHWKSSKLTIVTLALALPRTALPLRFILDIRSWEISIFSMWAMVLRSLEIRKSCVVLCVPPEKVTTTRSYPGMSLGLGSASARLICAGTLYRDRISIWILWATSGGSAPEEVGAGV